MPRQAPGEAAINALPRSYTCAHDADWDWKEQAACRGLNTPGSPFKDAWTVEPSDRIRLADGTVIRGQALIEIALSFCAGCPVQWQCTTWALEVEERLGTWGMAWADLRWLADQPEWRSWIIDAQRRSEVVQYAVANARGYRTGTVPVCHSANPSPVSLTSRSNGSATRGSTRPSTMAV